MPRSPCIRSLGPGLAPPGQDSSIWRSAGPGGEDPVSSATPRSSAPEHWDGGAESQLKSWLNIPSLLGQLLRRGTSQTVKCRVLHSPASDDCHHSFLGKRPSPFQPAQGTPDSHFCWASHKSPQTGPHQTRTLHLGRRGEPQGSGDLPKVQVLKRGRASPCPQSAWLQPQCFSPSYHGGRTGARPSLLWDSLFHLALRAL